MAAYGLYTHIQSNKRRSVVLLVGLFVLVYLLVYAGALAAEALSYPASLQFLLRRAWYDFIAAAPWATVATLLWVVIAYYFHQTMIDAITGGREVTRQEEPRLYNLLENLCISRGITMPKLKVMDSDALNAFATGMNEKQYAITVTTALLARLDDNELEAVLGHELTHVQNRDVVVMTIASFFASIAAFITQFGFFFGGGFGGGRNNQNNQGNAFIFVILISAAVYVISFLLLQALSRYREFAADRGSAILTGRPSALISALMKISGTMQRIPDRDLRSASGELAAFYIFPPKAKQSVTNLFSTHPPLEARIAALQRLEAQLQGTA
jgi:heat shock protein HtpX